MLNPLKSYFNLGVQAAHITPIWKARARILTPTCPHSHTPSHVPTHLVAGLAAGLIPVVSERGGLVENVGWIGRSFPNGDASALAAVLRALLERPQPFPSHEAQALIAPFQPATIAARYERLYSAITAAPG